MTDIGSTPIRVAIILMMLDAALRQSPVPQGSLVLFKLGNQPAKHARPRHGKPCRHFPEVRR